MAGAQLVSIRKRLGLGRLLFGYLVGMTGEEENIKNTIKRYESGMREISPMLERLAIMLLWFHEDHGYIPDLDKPDRIAWYRTARAGVANE